MKKKIRCLYFELNDLARFCFRHKELARALGAE